MSSDNNDSTLDLSDFEEVTEPIEGEVLEANEGSEDEADEAGENGTGEGDEPKGKTLKERFGEITKARRDAERKAQDATREASDARRESYEMRRRLEELESRLPKAETPKQPEAPKSEDYDLGDLDPQYISDLIDWKAEQKLAARFEEIRTTSAQEREAALMARSYEARVEAAGEKYADYDDVVTQGAARGEWPCTETMGLTILNSDTGPDLAYFLATNVKEAARIANLHPMDQARELGRLEAKLSAPAAPEPNPTRAPIPPRNQNRGSGGQFATTASARYQKAREAMR